MKLVFGALALAAGGLALLGEPWWIPALTGTAAWVAGCLAFGVKADVRKLWADWQVHKREHQGR